MSAQYIPLLLMRGVALVLPRNRQVARTGKLGSATMGHAKGGEMTTVRSTVRHNADGSVHIVIEGALDERSDLAVLDRIDADATLNMRGIERVNSIGIHRWIPIIGKLSDRRRIVIEEIPYPLVLAANSVANLFGQATLISCLAPYYCNSCGESRTVLVSAMDLAGSEDVPEKRCETCRSALSFDELDGYFRFLRPRHTR